MKAIDWTAIREAMDRESWKPGVKPGPDADAYEMRRTRLLTESEMPDGPDDLCDLVDEARANGYGSLVPPGDGLWVSEYRYPGQMDD
jgi:hypothetical protein